MSRRALFAGSLVLASACSPFGAGAGAEPSSDGGTPGESPGTLMDGGPSSDASEDGGEPGRSPCSEQHSFCEDFGGPLPWEAWTDNTTPSSPCTRDTERFVSPPASFGLVVAPDPTGTDHPAFLRRELPASQRVQLRARLAVTMSTGMPNGEVDVLALDLVEPSGFDRFYVSIVARSNGKFVLQTKHAPTAQSVKTQEKELGPLGPDFRTFAIDLDLDKGKVIASMDGKPPVIVDLAAVQGPSSRLDIGAPWANNTVKFAVNIDDVVVDL